MKIRETRQVNRGFQGSVTEERVRELAEGEEAPESAESVPDETPVSDWHVAEGA